MTIDSFLDNWLPAGPSARAAFRRDLNRVLEAEQRRVAGRLDVEATELDIRGDNRTAGRLRTLAENLREPRLCLEA